MYTKNEVLRTMLNITGWTNYQIDRFIQKFPRVWIAEVTSPISLADSVNNIEVCNAYDELDSQGA
jgi:hypothetical protein